MCLCTVSIHLFSELNGISNALLYSARSCNALQGPPRASAHDCKIASSVGDPMVCHCSVHITECLDCGSLTESLLWNCDPREGLRGHDKTAPLFRTPHMHNAMVLRSSARSCHKSLPPSWSGSTVFRFSVTPWSFSPVGNSSWKGFGMVSCVGLPEMMLLACEKLLAGTARVTSDIFPVVSVPVLSEQITLTQPKVSTASNFRTNTLQADSCREAIINESVTVGNRPSGT
mmetsp:Transcript_137192/g.273778  ORF Transcript_137192/g.273778 Transcript_137192/m.273778 type:complete len:230 (-) Transcript_137192:1571-2260(-)